MMNNDVGVQYAFFNNISLSMDPNSPSMLERIFGNNENAVVPANAKPGTLGWHTIKVKRGEVIDFVINNHDGEC